MRRFGIALLFLSAVTCLASTGQTVSYSSGSETVSGMVYAPPGKGPHPALIVIHEWWGMDDWVKDQASKLADQGYLTLAVDLYRGKVTNKPDEAHELSRGLPEDRAKRDLQAAVAYLKSRKDVDPKRIGSIGWCMGGGYSLGVAVMDPTLAASVINYGHLATDENDLKKVNAAVLGIFGGQDRGIPVEDVRKFEQQMKQLGKKIEVVVYRDAGHAFENPNNKNGYRPQDAADAWKKTVSFLDANLKKGGPRKAKQA
jgi:carboxymethylenebutenolidase